MHSDATYDVAHVWRGAFFRLEDHLDRFERGMARLRMSLPYRRDEKREVLFECVRLSGLRDSYVEMICTRGTPPPGSRDPRECENRFYAFAVPFVWIAKPDQQERGLHAIISRVQRIQPESIDPTVKNYHWLDLTAGLYEAYSHGGETVILVDHEDNVVEGPGFNIFTVKGGEIFTPEIGVLEGITRKTVFELATEHDTPLEQRAVSSKELRDADEVFATSTAGGIMPVTQVDGRTVGNGKPGLVTLRLRKGYWDLHQDAHYIAPIEYDDRRMY